MTVWLTSDEHYGHRNIIEFCGRPFAGIEDMEDGLVARHNARVANDDEVWHLGDFSFDRASIGRILGRLHGRHYLVAGNHDHPHPRCTRDEARREKRASAYRLAGFEDVFLHVENWHGFDLCHLPRLLEGDDRPHLAPRMPDTGRILLCGHVHEKWTTRKREINVGVDRHGWAPVSLDEVRAIAIEAFG